VLARASRVEITGTVTQGEQTLPFTLRLKGDKTRLEIGERVVVKQGGAAQWFEGQTVSSIQAVENGYEDAYLVPFLALSELPSRFEVSDSQEGYDSLVAVSRRERFIVMRRKRSCSPLISIRRPTSWRGRASLQPKALIHR